LFTVKLITNKLINH